MKPAIQASAPSTPIDQLPKLDGGEEAERAIELLVEKYERYRLERPGLPVLAVDVGEWRGWAASP